MVPKSHFAPLAQAYRRSLRLRENFTTRRRKVISIYTAKVGISRVKTEAQSDESWRKSTTENFGDASRGHRLFHL
jgi:hypothetical protein